MLSFPRPNKHLTSLCLLPMPARSALQTLGEKIWIAREMTQLAYSCVTIKFPRTRPPQLSNVAAAPRRELEGQGCTTYGAKRLLAFLTIAPQTSARPREYRRRRIAYILSTPYLTVPS
ncbi:hypothetical protein B0H67DRAFT_34609 [Lasiosphaeris hirsuta]|uniref:Uncharacterized protein n=1 Tax=Lasiosphaeris hirsuta TaxID=260670 RepID=A0AA40ECM0_9PEZI|nr:hypothetical protein B0H67DRAFT_34609 [Lasiosphaeris hirsuta]